MILKRRRGALLLGAIAIGASLIIAACDATDIETESANRLSGLATCEDPNDIHCETDQRDFSVDSAIIYASVTVNQPVAGTEALATMSRIDGDSRQKILSYSVGIEPEEGDEKTELAFFFDSSSNTGNGGRWVAGEYEIEVIVHASEAEPLRTTIRLD